MGTSRAGKRHVHRDDVRYREGPCILARYGGESAWGVWVGGGPDEGGKQVAGPFDRLRDARAWCRSSTSKTMTATEFLSKWATSETRTEMFADLVALGAFVVPTRS